MKLVPETGTFISLLMDKGENIDTFKEEIQTLNSLLEPLLEDLHSILVSTNYYIENQYLLTISKGLWQFFLVLKFMNFDY